MPSVNMGGAAAACHRPQQASSCSVTPSQPCLAPTRSFTPLHRHGEGGTAYVRPQVPEALVARSVEVLAAPLSGRQGTSPSPLAGRACGSERAESSAIALNMSLSHVDSQGSAKCGIDDTKPPSACSHGASSPQEETCCTFTLVDTISLRSSDAGRYFPYSPSTPVADGAVDLLRQGPASPALTPHEPPSTSRRGNTTPSIVKSTRSQHLSSQTARTRSQQGTPKSSQVRRPLISTGNNSAKRGKSTPNPVNTGSPVSAALTTNEEARKLKERRRRELYAWNADLKKKNETVYIKDAV
ncbi:hypothetical protein STCU_11244 [Strigomonas culicis]|uniref:Uncharacterized protein n=1 Tax=Strigomonas culicis TaxID=28005 RepID=S9UP43_9TRYP|nr:hypothetical protein STCU_11244 [Strigomonas culicis]|eukprot:EPY16456.1 hypothetical protein STCU_11244 [Strigomonas culicis]